jgi:hypothetical protein
MKTAVITFSRNDGYKEKERFAIHLTELLETFDEVNYVVLVALYPIFLSINDSLLNSANSSKLTS